MSTGLYTIVTRATGTIVTAAIYNSDHQNHVNNQNPEETGAYSDTVSQMQTATDPGDVGTEVLAGNLAGELAELRAMFIRIFGLPQWYSKLSSTLKGGLLRVTSAGGALVPLEGLITAGGTADALTATFSVFAGNAPFAGLEFEIKATAPNATTTPTIAINGGSAITITKQGGQALVAGDIFGAGHVLKLKGTGATTIELLNPATTVSATPNVVPQGHIAGFLPSSIAGTNSTASLSCSAGQASDTTNAVFITSANPISWAVSNGNAINGYSGGTTLPNSSTIHFYTCKGASGVGLYAIPNSGYPLTAASAPAGYNIYVRRGFSLNTNSSGALLPYTAIETSGGSIRCYLTTQVLDASSQAVTSASRLLKVMGSVPLGIKVGWVGRAQTNTASDNFLFTSPDETDVAVASSTAAPQYDMLDAASNIAFTGSITTDTSGRIGIRAGSSTTYTFSATTRGWDDFRRS